MAPDISQVGQGADGCDGHAMILLGCCRAMMRSSVATQSPKTRAPSFPTDRCGGNAGPHPLLAVAEGPLRAKLIWRLLNLGASDILIWKDPGLHAAWLPARRCRRQVLEH